HGNQSAANLETGTKASANYMLRVLAGETITLKLRLTKEKLKQAFDSQFESVFSERIKEADEFYAAVIPKDLSSDAKNVMRQAFAGMLWSKQFYGYDVNSWLQGDSTQPTPPTSRKNGRNKEWAHLYNDDIISMPDKWEYPWYAAWDLAFHCIALALVDS